MRANRSKTAEKIEQVLGPWEVIPLPFHSLAFFVLNFVSDWSSL